MQTDWVKRYIYAVTKELPESQRKDLEKELNGLIEDMLEERLQGKAAETKDIEAVLKELGNPHDLADKYRDRKRYLIGPKIFPFYLSILKIVSMAIGIAMLVLFIIKSFEQPAGVLDHFFEVLLTFFAAIFQSFTWITIGFGISEYFNLTSKDLDLQDRKNWKLNELPEIPSDSNKISRAEPIFSIIFIVLFAAIFALSSKSLGVWFFQEGQPMLVVPFFTQSVLLSYLPFILGSMLLDVLVEFAKFVSGKWTFKLIGLDFLLKVVHLVVGLVVFANPLIWNPDFIAQLSATGLITTGSEGMSFFSNVWNAITGNMIFIIIFAFILEIIGMTAKVIRLRK